MSGVRPEVLARLAETFPGAVAVPMAGDASARRFLRLRLPAGGSRVVVDYGAPFPDETDDIRLSRIFRDAGLPVPRIDRVDPDPGILVVEDLGPETLEHVLRAPGTSAEEAERLHLEAARLAARVATGGTAALARSERASGPALDPERFRFEMDYFLEHWLGGLLRLPAPDGLREALHGLADGAAAVRPTVMCHRDFHSRNLMVRADRTLAMVDIQDARWGPDGYDLASLVRDAYVEVPEPRVEAMIDAFLGALPSPPNRVRFVDRLHRVSLQRMIKALGTFGYQVHVRGHGSYLEAVPRTLARIRSVAPSVPGGAGLLRLLEAAGALEAPPLSPSARTPAPGS